MEKLRGPIREIHTGGRTVITDRVSTSRVCVGRNEAPNSVYLSGQTINRPSRKTLPVDARVLNFRSVDIDRVAAVLPKDLIAGERSVARCDRSAIGSDQRQRLALEHPHTYLIVRTVLDHPDDRTTAEDYFIFNRVLISACCTNNPCDC